MKQKLTSERHSLTIVTDTAPIELPFSKEINNQLVNKFRLDSFFKNMEEKSKKHFELNPGTKKSDIYPQPEDFLLFPFRLISATTVGSGSWKSTDFSNEKVLKESIALLQNKPAYTNHQLYVGNEIGTIGNCEWVSATKDVPAGIDGPYVIDSKVNAELCRKLLSPVSPIQSSSVTVIFDWESSHEFENPTDFYYHVGEVINGEEVRRIVTKIHDYIESSLVYLGADPYAKIKMGDNQYLNVDRSSVMSNSKYDEDKLKELHEKEHKFFVINSFKKENKIYLQNDKQNPEMEVKEIAAKEIAALFNVSEEKVTVDFIKGQIAGLNSSVTSLTKEKEDLEKKVTEKDETITSLNKDKETLQGEITALKADESFISVGKKLLEDKQKLAVETYTKSVNGKIDDVIIGELKACGDSAMLDAKIKLFGGKLINDFSSKCNKCGSEDISFRSSVVEEPTHQPGVYSELHELLD